jgi:sulfite exporter TauE/SafE
LVSRSVIYGALAGLAAGLVTSLAILILDVNLVELSAEMVREWALHSGIPPEQAAQALEQVESLTRSLTRIAPLVEPLETALLGAFFGLVHGLLWERRGVHPAASAAATGSLMALLTAVLPLFIFSVSSSYSWIADVILKHVGLEVVLLPYPIYAAVLALLSTVPGPWRRLAEEKPSKY